MKLTVSIYIRSKDDVTNYFNYNKEVDIEGYEVLIRDICDAINRGEVRKKLKEIGEESLEE